MRTSRRLCIAFPYRTRPFLSSLLEHAEEILAGWYGYLQPFIGFLAWLAFSDESLALLVCHNASILPSRRVSEQFSHELKLNRASYHLDRLEAEVREWRERETHRYVSHFDRESGKHLVHIRFPEPVPAEFRLTIGDCLHNLRSALDNLAYELAVRHHGSSPLPEPFDRRSEFPIFGDREWTTRERRNKIGRIHPRAQAIIKRLQPHNRGDEFASDPLWMLHELNNMDKHRAPHITQVAISTWADVPDAPLLPGTINIYLGPFEDGAEIASYTPHTSLAEGFEPEMHMDPLLTFDIFFGEGSAAPGWRCGDALRWIRSHIIKDVAEPLADYLT